MLQRLDTADSVRREVLPRTARKDKSELGQFMTPSSVARFMVGMFPPSALQTCHLAGLQARASVPSPAPSLTAGWPVTSASRP
jgi:hypothetical protein